MRRALLITVLLTLTACDDYPSKWPAVKTSLLGGCPQINGTYALVTAEDVATHGLESGEMFRHVFAPVPNGGLWDTMTISGNAAQELTITLQRSPERVEGMVANNAGGRGGSGAAAALRAKQADLLSPQTRWTDMNALVTDEAYAQRVQNPSNVPNSRQFRTMNGTQFRCSGGWIETDRWAGETGPDRNNPRADHQNGAIRIGKDKTGNLVVHAIYKETKSLSLWASGGTGSIPLGTWTQHRWSRLLAAPALNGESASSTNAAATAVAAWSEPFQVPDPHPLAANADRRLLESRRQKIVAALPTGTRLVLLGATQDERGYDGVRITLASADTATLVKAIRALNRNDNFPIMNQPGPNPLQRVEALRKMRDGSLELWIWLRLDQREFQLH